MDGLIYFSAEPPLTFIMSGFTNMNITSAAAATNNCTNDWGSNATESTGTWGQPSSYAPNAWGCDSHDPWANLAEQQASYPSYGEMEEAAATPMQRLVLEEAVEDVYMAWSTPLCEICGEENYTTGRCCQEECYRRWNLKNRTKSAAYAVRGLGPAVEGDAAKKSSN